MWLNFKKKVIWISRIGEIDFTSFFKHSVIVYGSQDFIERWNLINKI